MSDDEICILFSGGTDSTLAAALQQEKFRKLHLVTYERFGITAIENSKINYEALVRKYGEDRFVHKVINFEKEFKHLSYENYVKNMFKFKFQLLSTCGICKLSMHARTIQYCLDHNIKYVSDGANQAMTIFPAQMKGVIDELKNMYKEFGITYTNPVFDFEAPSEKEYVSKDRLHLVNNEEVKEQVVEGNTAGKKLFELGLAPAPNVKGTSYDRERQPRCFQFVLFNIFAKKFYQAEKNYEKYESETRLFFKSKIKAAIKNIQRNRP